MQSIALLIFGITYLGIAIGRVPGLTLDRTGIAILGAIGMIASGVLTFKQAFEAIDLSTILLLYALMIISAQLRLGGFYTWVARWINSYLNKPQRFLLLMMLTSALLSAILANDIICLAFTPVLVVALIKKGSKPLPFLLGLAIASNIGSAATLIGNPQNMLIGQVGKLDFGRFLLWAIIPSLVALFASYSLICWKFRNHFDQQQSIPDNAEIDQNWPEFNRWQSLKGLTATLILICLFFTSIPRELSALTVAGVLLCSRKMKSREMLELVDWHLITLFCALFIIVQGISLHHLPSSFMAALSQQGIELRNLYILAGLSSILSNIVSNVPASMLFIQFLNPANPVEWYTLALASTFAGNLLIIGSIANLIVVEQVKRFDVEITFKDHAKIGIPVTLCSLLILVGWIAMSNALT